MAGVLVAAHVPPGPAVEAALLDVGDVVGDKIVAEVVALVDRAPQIARAGLNGLADAVADAGGVDLLELAVGGELEHVGAVLFLGMGVGVVDVGVGADGDEHVLPVGGKGDVAGPVAAAAELAAAGQVGEGLRGLGRLQVAVGVGVADDRVGVADVDVFGVRTFRVEADAERHVEVVGKGGHLLRLAVGADAAEDHDLVLVGEGDEEVAVGRGADEARLVETGGVLGDGKADRGLRQRAFGTRDFFGARVDAGGGVGLGQVGDGDAAGGAGLFLGVVGKGGLAGEDGLGLLSLEGGGGKEQAGEGEGARAHAFSCGEGSVMVGCEVGLRVSARLRFRVL